MDLKPALATLIILLLGGCASSVFRSAIPETEQSWQIHANGGPLLDDAGKPLGQSGGDGPASVALMHEYAGRVFLDKVGEDASAIRLGAYSASQRPYDDWIIYHIMLGYFANGDPSNDGAGLDYWVNPSYAGGDLQGIIDRLDHIEALGANAIWISPPFPCYSSHGYDVANYYAINGAAAYPDDPNRSLALFRQLVQQAHARKIKVILDLPLNHGARLYDFDNGDPKGFKPKMTRAIQIEERFFDRIGANFGYWDERDANTRAFLLDVVRYWLEEFDIDGYRLDYVLGMERAFWAEVYQTAKAVNPDVFLMGEVWLPDGSWPSALAAHYQAVEGISGKTSAQYDSIIEFPSHYVLRQVFAHSASTELLEAYLQNTVAAYPDHAQPAWFLDNHDVPRFAAINKDPERLVAAIKFIAALSGPMLFYYGTETGLTHEVINDPAMMHLGRIPMPWEDLNQPLLAQISAILNARATHPALSRGGRLPLYNDGKVMVMAKTHSQHSILVAVNMGNESREVSVSLGLLAAAGRQPQPLLSLSEARLEGDQLTWTIPALSTQYQLIEH